MKIFVDVAIVGVVVRKYIQATKALLKEMNSNNYGWSN